MYNFKKKKLIRDKHKECFNKDCFEEGVFPAPVSKQYVDVDYPQPKIYFCLEHIRIFNKNWDFFENMSEQEIYDFQLDALTGNRKNTANSENNNKQSNYQNFEEINKKLDDFFNINDRTRKRNIDYDIPNEIKESMDILGVCFPLKQDIIKKKYRILVKKYHPDKLGKTNDNKIKMINQAYSNITGFINKMEKLDCDS